MKKILISGVLVCMLFMTAACSGKPSKPEGMLDSTYKAAIKTMETVEDYKDEKITANEAYFILMDQVGRLESRGDSDDGYDVQDAIEDIEKMFGKKSVNMEKIEDNYNTIKDILN